MKPIILRPTVILFLGLILSGCNQYDPYHPDTSDIKGVWSLDNSTSRRADQLPVVDVLTVSGTHMEYTEGHGTEGVQGEWRADGFWVIPPNGNGGQIHAVEILDPEHVVLHLMAFDPNRPDTVKLYKVRGDDAEVKAIAALDPGPVNHPPPRGAIWPGITEYKLQCLPWKADRVVPAINLRFEDKDIPASAADAHSTDGQVVYIYKSNDPHIDDLRVTVKDHIVMKVTGGR